MKETIERERTTTTAVKTLRNDLRDEKVDHEDKVRPAFEPLPSPFHARSLSSIIFKAAFFAVVSVMVGLPLSHFNCSLDVFAQMREKKKTLLVLKEELKEVKMKTAVETR